MRKNGEIYDALISISSVKNINDEILFFVALERDITEEKEIDRAKTEFVSLASHQLRTPLAAIGWYTEMLLSQDVGEINDNQKSYLEEIENGNKRITELVQGLLDVSKIDMGVFNLDIEKINVHTIITILLKELEQDILSKNITIDSRISEEFTEFRADSRFLRIIFQNLITNAIKYTKDNTNIKLDLFQLEKGNQFGGKIFGYDTLAFSVQDFGMGIPENQQDKIFEKLFRADNAKKSVAEGTGLGLYLIKSIIDKSSGEVWFSSKEGEGTIFYITFPVSGMAITKEIQN